jgi:hypothetical protein
MAHNDVRGCPIAAPVANAVDIFPPTHYYRQPLLDTPRILMDVDPEKPLHCTQGNGGGCLEELRNAGKDYDATAMTPPIRRLPPELLTEIFLHCLPQFVQPHPNKAPLLLTQICSWWRCVCISSPQIWSSLELVYKVCETTSNLHDSKRNTEALVDLWLSRSGDCPLSLSLQEDASLVKHIQCLLNSDTMTRRLQCLKVVIPRRTYTAFLPETRYPRLLTLELNTPHGLSEANLKDTSSVFSNSPELRSFLWTNNHFTSSLITVQWSSLSLLHLTTAISIQNCLGVLEASTNAVTIHMKDIYLDLVQPLSREIILPRLATLVLASRVNISQVFECLTVPSLKVLMITFPAWPHAIMVNFFERCKFPLENLDIFFPPITDVEMLEVLDKVQGTLMELTLQTESPTVTDFFLEKLTFTTFPSPLSIGSSGPEPFCRKLESIALYNCTACTPGGVARMVESRSHCPSSSSPPMVVPLRMVEALDTEPELKSLVSLRRLGVQVVVYSEDTGSVVDEDGTVFRIDEHDDYDSTEEEVDDANSTPAGQASMV